MWIFWWSLHSFWKQLKADLKMNCLKKLYGFGFYSCHILKYSPGYGTKSKKTFNTSPHFLFLILSVRWHFSTPARGSTVFPVVISPRVYKIGAEAVAPLAASVLPLNNSCIKVSWGRFSVHKVCTLLQCLDQQWMKIEMLWDWEICLYVQRKREGHCINRT